MYSKSSGLSTMVQPEASSSRPRKTSIHRATVDDSSTDDEETLASDPLDGRLPDSFSFKRMKPKPTLSKFLTSPTTPGSSRQASPLPRSVYPQSRGRSKQPEGSQSTEAILPYLNAPTDAGTNLHEAKDASAVDWYVEGPGRRVGYDDLTAIDWIFEYAKERQRLRVLHSGASGLLGHIRHLIDASQSWIVLILTGACVGLVAGSIDIVSDWLGDVKTGICRTGEKSGRFYLSKEFCCWGYDKLAECEEWNTWGSMMGIGSSGSKWLVNYILYIFFSILFASCACVLVLRFAPYARHSGIPEVKTVLGGFVIRRFMGVWTLIIKSLGLCLSVASGLWLGKEGPLVHVACCFANLFMKFFPSINGNEARKREVLSAAAASGISAAFGAPLAGVLFSLEQLSYYFPDKTMWQSFVCAMVAAFSLRTLNPFRTGQLVLYEVTYHSGWHGFELIPFMFVGVLGGLYGSAFIKMNMKVSAWRKNTRILTNPVHQVIVVTALTAIIGFPIKFMRAQASELIFFLFSECSEIKDDQLGVCKSGHANTEVVTFLVLSALLGLGLAVITFGLQIPAGILLPSMAIGALYGRAVGIMVYVWQKTYPDFILFSSCEPDVRCVTAGTYAIVGAASALAGATRLTVSIVVITFELTGALTYVLPIMIAVMISKWVGDAIAPKGIYEAWIEMSGYPFLASEDDLDAVPDVPAAQVMTRIEDLVVITAAGHTITSLQRLLASHPFRGFPIIDNESDALLLGYISRGELEYALSAALHAPRNLRPDAEAHFSHAPLADLSTSLDLRPWMDHTPITLNARARLNLTVSMFQKLGLRYVVFTERGVLRGLLTKKDVWFVLNDAGGREDGRLREIRTSEDRGLLGMEDGRDEDEPDEDGVL